MEASEAVEATEAPSEGVESTEVESGQETGNDYGPILDRIGQLEKSIDQKLTPAEPDFFDPQYAEQDDFGWDEAEQEQGYDDLPPEVQEIIDARVQQHLGPIEQRLTAQQQEQLAERKTQESLRLEQEYPELASQEGASKAIQASRDAALELGRLEGLPADMVRELAHSPAFVELAYLASRARDTAAQEVPAASQGVELEGSGASPGPEPEEDAIDRAARAGDSGFWGEWSSR